jgi:hypothetical protein
MDIGVSAMMTGSETGYPGLARLIGCPESTGDQIIVNNMQVTARRRAAAAMSTAMMNGDVGGFWPHYACWACGPPSTKASK